MSPSPFSTGAMGNFHKPSGRPQQRARSAPASFSTTPTRGFQSSNWRETMGTLPAIVMPSFDNLKLGMVFQLPGDQDVKDAIGRLGLEATNRPWDHPAVVVAKYVENGEEWVKIRTCTTFDQRHVEAVKEVQQQTFFLLAENTTDVKPHGETKLGKMAPGSAVFGKRTYVNLSRNSVYPVKYTMLKLFNNKLPMQFDEEALDMIMRNKPF